jgi:saccharopepsin
MVDLEALIRFIFPTELQHAMSTGRLLAFGFYGPLDADAKLRSGHKGSHVVGRWELDTMCRQFEREDILQVYMPDGKSSSSLSAEESEQLLAQADSRLKMAKGKAMMQQVTEEEVRSLFDDLKRSDEGLLLFHEMQERIVEFRKESIQRNKVIFPDLISHSIGKKKKTGRRQQAVTVKRTSGKVSSDVAPATMFEANKGYNPMELATQTNRLLATRAYQICDIEHGNSPSLTSNVRLVRETCTKTRPENVQHPKVWDSYCAKRGTHMGAFVNSAKSSTTVKRSTTIA